MSSDIFKVVQNWSFRHPLKECVVDDVTLTYSELVNEAIAIANILYSSGVDSNTRVALIGDNSANFVKLYVALARINAICFVLPSESRPSEDRYCELEIDYEVVTTSVVQKSSVIHTAFNSLGDCGFIRKIKSVNKKRNQVSNDVKVLLSTSGTTSGKPKLVMHSWDGLLINARQHATAVGLNHDDRCLLVLPVVFSFAHTCQLLSTLLVGGTVIFHNNNPFSVEKFMNIVKQYGVTTTCLVAYHLQLLSRNRTALESLNSCGIEKICFAGGPTPRQILQELTQRCPRIQFFHAYGLTEAGPRVAISKMDDHLDSELGSVGQIVDGTELRIVSENGKDLEYHQVGEIVVKSPSIMKGYYGDNNATSSTLKQGWLHTGDLGCLDEQNRLYIYGRKKNLIITLGRNIYPEEVEAVLNEYYAVSESLVLGIPHSLAGQLPVAVLVLNENSKFNLTEFYSYCRERLEAYQVPRKVFFVDRLKRTVSGKLTRSYEDYEGLVMFTRS